MPVDARSANVNQRCWSARPCYVQFIAKMVSKRTNLGAQYASVRRENAQRSGVECIAGLDLREIARGAKFANASVFRLKLNRIVLELQVPLQGDLTQGLTFLRVLHDLKSTFFV